MLIVEKNSYLQFITLHFFVLFFYTFEDLDKGDEVCDESKSMENESMDDVVIDGDKVVSLQIFIEADKNILPFDPQLF